MKYRGKRVLGLEANLRLPIVFLLCFCFFLAGLFGSIILSQDVNRGGSRHKLLQDSRDDVGGFVVQGASEESFPTSIPFQVLSWRPRALYFPNFATDKQCQSIIEKAKSKLKPSSLALRKGETVESTKGVRTRYLSWCVLFTVLAHSSVHQKTLQELWNLLRIKLLEQLCYRGAMERSFLRYSHITILQAFNVLRYEVEQRYVSHYDAFNPAEYGPLKSQRVASFLLYLTDVEEGGETMFPFESGLNMNTGYDYQSCIGLKVRPRRGDGLLFYSLFPNGTIDPTSLHGSCPVVKGEKWVATKWIRDKERGSFK